jgi:hypothetical protein
MIVNFGVPGILYYAFPALGLQRVALAERPEIARACAALLVIAYGYGMSISMAEESFFCIVWGFCFGAAIHAFRSDRHAHRRRP